MKQYLNNSLIFGLLLVFGTNCSKYDDGGNSFQAKNKICEKTWIEIIPRLRPTENLNDTNTLIFKENGTVILYEKNYDSTNSFQTTWSLNDHNNTISIGSGQNSVYEIIKLTKDEFWFKFYINPINAPEVVGIISNSKNQIEIIRKLKAIN